MGRAALAALVAAAPVAVAVAQPARDVRYDPIVAEVLVTPEGRALLEAFWAIQRDYLGTVDPAVLLEGALRGLVSAVGDPYVRYLDPDELAIERRTTRGPVPVVAGTIGDIGYLRLLSFDSEAAGDRFAEEFHLLADRGVRGLVVDLRGNPGGLILGGLQVLDLFLTDAVLGYRQTRFGPVPLGFANPRYAPLPLAVLVDRDTASTAEIVAGALQTHRRARLYGEVTAGKGVGQSTVPLSDGGELRLVTFAWVLPDGRDVHGWGLTPDVAVRGQVPPLAAADLARVVVEPDLDPALTAAVRGLRRVLGDELAGVAKPADGAGGVVPVVGP